jgi:hypothetical protein
MNSNDESEAAESMHGCTNGLGLAFGEAFGSMGVIIHIDTDSRIETSRLAAFRRPVPAVFYYITKDGSEILLLGNLLYADSMLIYM